MSIKVVKDMSAHKNRGSTPGKDTFAPTLTLSANFNSLINQALKSSESEALCLALQLLEETLGTEFLRVVRLPSAGLVSLANQLSLHSPFPVRPRTLTVPLPNGLGMFVIVLLSGLEGNFQSAFGSTFGSCNSEVPCICTYASPLSPATKRWMLVDVSRTSGTRSWLMLGDTKEFVFSRIREATVALPNNTGNALWNGFAKVLPPMSRSMLPRPSVRIKRVLEMVED